MSMKLKRLLAALFALTMFAAACSSDDGGTVDSGDDATDDSSTTTTTEAAPDDTDPVDEGEGEGEGEGDEGAAGDFTITADPASAAPGETTFTVSGSGFTPGNSLFVVPCDKPESGNAEDISSDTCDISNLTPVTVGDDGTFEAEVTYEVPEGGMAIAAGDAAQSETAAVIIEAA